MLSIHYLPKDYSQHNDTSVKLRVEFLAYLFKFTGKCKSVQVSVFNSTFIRRSVMIQRSLNVKYFNSFMQGCNAVSSLYRDSFGNNTCFVGQCQYRNTINLSNFYMLSKKIKTGVYCYVRTSVEHYQYSNLHNRTTCTSPAPAEMMS